VTHAAHNRRIGKLGEDAAAAYLASRGYEILARNVRTPHGEIDLIVRAPEGYLAFVEVKTRTGDAFGAPEEAITAAKWAHMVAAAEYWLYETDAAPQADWQIDVIAVRYPSPRTHHAPHIVHFPNIQGP